jgi:hypothetical protein
MTPLSRRELLEWLAAQGLMPSLGPDAEAALARLGKAYLIEFPLERQALSGLMGRFSAAGLDDAVRGDFAEGRTVLLDGWRLSRTEARLCAAIALRERS